MISSEQCLEKFGKEYSFRLDIKTINLYQKSVIQLLTYCEKQFQDITTRDIRNWLLYLLENGYKSSSIKNKLAGLKLFYKYCVEEGIINHNPAASVPFPSVEEKLPYYLQHDQLIQLRELIKEKTFERVQERAIIELLYATGMRISELAALKKEDICWTERTIIIQKGKRKKGRIVLFTRYCAEYLQMYLQMRKDNLPFVFLNSWRKGPVGTRTIQYDFNEYAKQLEIHLTPHTLRHTFAAHLSMKGMPLECIQVLLGHNGPHQTQLYARLYSHARKEMYDEWM
ncbi:tyrosine-type recombinase/integrase [Bacillus sp. JJ664]